MYTYIYIYIYIYIHIHTYIHTYICTFVVSSLVSKWLQSCPRCIRLKSTSALLMVQVRWTNPSLGEKTYKNKQAIRSVFGIQFNRYTVRTRPGLSSLRLKSTSALLMVHVRWAKPSVGEKTSTNKQAIS